jgi:hypothetical protein
MLWIKNLLLRFQARNYGYMLEPMPDSEVFPKTLLVEKACMQIPGIIQGAKIDRNKMTEAVKFLENVFQYWEDYISDIESDYDKNEIASTVAYGLSEYYQYSNKMTVTRTSEYLLNDLKSRMK